MSIFKDWQEDTDGYRFRAKATHFVNPREWLRLHKWRKQRADRGWSDRDTWGAGNHIAKITAEILQHLNDHTYVDWPEWFKLNAKEKGAYKNLQQVIDDINAYLDHEKTSWADGLETRREKIDEMFEKREDGNYEWIRPDWYEGEKKLTEAAIKNRINKWSKESNKKYEQAKKALSFFSRNFSGFWD
jgi:hypothetical protein